MINKMLRQITDFDVVIYCFHVIMQFVFALGIFQIVQLISVESLVEILSESSIPTGKISSIRVFWKLLTSV